MAGTVVASVLTAPETFELREFPRPSVTADTALLRVEAAGLCGSDIEEYKGTYPYRYPVIPGHETVGVIEEIGDVAAQRWGVTTGDRVAVEFSAPCGRCRSCREGSTILCQNISAYEWYGFRPTADAPGLWGGYAQYMYLQPQSVLHRVSPEIPAEIAVMYNPLGAGVQWVVEDGGAGIGDTVVILGSGQRGLAGVIAAKSAGAGTIIVTDVARSRDKLELAHAFGADHTIVADEDDVTEKVHGLTGGAMADVVVDTAANATQAALDAITLARRGGTVVFAGMKPALPSFPIQDVLYKYLTLKGVCGVASGSYRKAIDIIETGAFPLARMHTHDFTLDEADLALRTLMGAIPGQTAVHMAIRP
ncbi:zinc-dependent alcohol dehydrogenase [Amycolatopsis anabasis]|uniref:zinc-dependent alcohol dehydrogenase n=1 Tax=Amycolatopsis anabasis TaxID=1840409 RepID=UPI00131B69AB|nr:zinc-binding dehydrogenase [Amycolatopsis anabasis]